MCPLSECRLYAFVDTAYLHGRDPVEVARRLCDGGADLIQLRAKQSSLPEIRRLAEVLLPVTRAAGVGLVINDFPELAREVGAELCHLGQEDFFDRGYTKVDELTGPAAIPPSQQPDCRGRREESFRTEPLAQRTPHVVSYNPPLRIGLSTHAPAQAERALAAGADYIAIGPVFATGTKPTARPVTLEYVRWAAAHITIPWFAIGGITLQNLGDVLAAGARRVCVVSAILNSNDVAGACRAFNERLTSA